MCLFSFLKYVRLLIFEVHKYSILILKILLFIKKKCSTKIVIQPPKQCYLNSNNSQCSVIQKHLHEKKHPKIPLYTIIHSQKILPTLSPKTTQHKKPIDNDYWLKICTKIVMLIKTSDKRKWNEFWSYWIRIIQQKIIQDF